MQRANYARGLRFLPKVASITVGLISAAIAFQASAQTINVYTQPVGFMNVGITNVSGGYNSMALPLQQIPNDRGAIGAAGVTQLNATQDVIDVSGGCTTCATANYGLATSLNYVELETGHGTGYRFTVATNTATSITVYTGGTTDLVSLGVATGDNYVVFPYFRIIDVFGPATGGYLANGSSQSKADNVEVWNGSNFIVYWPKNNGNWIGGVNQGFDPLLPDESVLVLRQSAASTNIITLGQVRVTNFVSVLDSGYNLVGNSFPASTVVSNLNLVGSGSGFQGGSALAKSDQVLVWNGLSFDQIWYKSTTSSWQGGNGLLGAYPILPSSTYFVYLQPGHSGFWPRPLPYTP